MGKPDPRRANGNARDTLIRIVRHEETHCHLCTQHVDKTLPQTLPASPELDELTPVSQGGNPLDRRNVRLSHRHCNNWRGIRPVAIAQAELAANPPRFNPDGTLRTTDLKPRTSRNW